MGTRDPHIDVYIERSNEFARPILMHLRQVIHSTCPTVQETTKWSVPFFMYGGSNLASMAAFKQHCAFGFWKGSQIVENDAATEKAMGQFGRITSLADLPSAVVLKRYIKAAMQLNDDKTAAPRTPTKRAPKPTLAMAEDLKKALARTRGATAQFARFAPGRQREYIEWLEEAKTDGTRQRRLATAAEWIAEGKSRHWKYQKG